MNYSTLVLLSPCGSLSLAVPIAAIASANAEVIHVMEAPGRNWRKGHYNIYTPEQKAIIEKHALEIGVMTAKRKFSKKLQMDINESTINAHFKVFELVDSFVGDAKWFALRSVPVNLPCLRPVVSSFWSSTQSSRHLFSLDSVQSSANILVGELRL